MSFKIILIIVFIYMNIQERLSKSQIIDDEQLDNDLENSDDISEEKTEELKQYLDAVQTLKKKIKDKRAELKKIDNEKKLLMNKIQKFLKKSEVEVVNTSDGVVELKDVDVKRKKRLDATLIQNSLSQALAEENINGQKAENIIKSTINNIRNNRHQLIKENKLCIKKYSDNNKL